MARMDAHRDLAIPVGAVVIEAWSDEEGITILRDARYEVTTDGSAHPAEDFEYRADGAWPDPKAMIEELHARGIKVILWQIPLQKTEFEHRSGGTPTPRRWCATDTQYWRPTVRRTTTVVGGSPRR